MLHHRRLLLPAILSALAVTACDADTGTVPATDDEQEEEPRRLEGHGSDSSRYEMIALEGLTGGFGRAFGINGDGVVVGMSEADGEPRAFRWEDGSVEWLEGLGGSISAAYAINDDGMIVGEAENEAGDLRAVAWIDGEAVELGTLGGATSQAVAVNREGRVVGRAENDEGVYRPFVWWRDRMEELPLPSGTSQRTYASADGINDVGDAVGTVRGETGQWALLWSGERVTVLESPCSTAAASDLNTLGQIVGSGSGCPASPAVGVPLFWDGEGPSEHLEPLGGLRENLESPTLQNGGDALAINDWGEIVGWSSLRPDDFEAVRATLWYTESVVNLGGEPGSGRLRFAGAADVNEAGVAVGVSNETPVRFLLDSASASPSAPASATELQRSGAERRSGGATLEALIGSRAGEAWAVKLCGESGRGRVSGALTVADLLAGCGPGL